MTRRDRRAFRRTDEDRFWHDYRARARRDLYPLLRDSAAYLGLSPSGEPDAKWCLELGAAIMLDKPIVLIVRPGLTLPARLRRVADAVIEDADVADPATQGRIEEALRRLGAL